MIGLAHAMNMCFREADRRESTIGQGQRGSRTVGRGGEWPKSNLSVGDLVTQVTQECVSSTQSNV